MANILANPWSFTSADASLFTVSGVTETGYIATATTSAPHGYVVGNLVAVAGVAIGAAAPTVGYGYNGLVKVLSVPSATTFTYAPLTQGGLPVQGLGAGGAGTTGLPVYKDMIRGEDMSWQDATAADTIIVRDINGNLIWKATAPTTGNYSRSKPYWIRGIWIQALPSGDLVLTVN